MKNMADIDKFMKQHAFEWHLDIWASGTLLYLTDHIITVFPRRVIFIEIYIQISDEWKSITDPSSRVPLRPTL